ncbi:MAG: hypothetical protein SVU69_04440 [Pseudomonadota bacterium]|nr:hypothetical protein [Pseudomonadota bacterium]
MRNIVVTSLLAAMLASCSLGSPDAEVLKSLESPDRRYAVLVVRLNHHATVPYVYKVFVLEAGDTVDYFGDLDVLRVGAIDGLSVEWSGANSVDIACVVGKVYKYYNYAFIDDQNFTINLNTRCTRHPE